MRRNLLLATSGSAALWLGTTAAVAQVPPAPYFNGLEVEQETLPTAEQVVGVTRVPSGTDGVPASDGWWLAVVGPTSFNDPAYVLSSLGGYSSTWPEGGWTVTTDVWLDPTMSPVGEDRRFDWSAAVDSTELDADGNPLHRRDIILNLGTDLAGGFVASASNSAPGWPSDPSRDPVFFDAPADGGWFTIRHTFRDAEGVLAVDVELVHPDGTVVGAWTLSNPADVITEVGGNRYGWLVTNSFPTLHIDNVTRTTNTPEPQETVVEQPHDNRNGDKHNTQNNRDGDKHVDDGHGHGSDDEDQHDVDDQSADSTDSADSADSADEPGDKKQKKSTKKG